MEDWIDVARIEYVVSYGISGGTLFVQLVNGSAVPGTLLGMHQLGVDHQGTETKTSERGLNDTLSLTANAGLAKGIIAGLTGKASREKNRKESTRRERKRNIPAMQPDGSGVSPRWAFYSEDREDYLRGEAPGLSSPPLALIEEKGRPVEALAVFLVSDEDIKGIKVASTSFNRPAPVDLAFAQKRLPDQLRRKFRVVQGRLMIAAAGAAYPAPAGGDSAFLFTGDGDEHN
jgi:hypothetical protein